MSERLARIGLILCLLAGGRTYAQNLLLGAAAQGLQQTQTMSTVKGTVKDIHGRLIEGARVTLTGPGRLEPETTLTGPDGRFAFMGIPSGTFTLTVKAAGLAIHVGTGTVGAGATVEVPSTSLPIPASFASVQVVASKEDVAAAQVEVEEKQRVLAVFPNFYVTYIQNPAPMTSKQKFQMAFRTTIDPVTFGLVGVAAGIEQANNTYSGYGDGAAGFGRRYGSALGDDTISIFLAGALLPSVLHQDPRYFYKGTGSVKARIVYAAKFIVVCKGDNGRWQPNYSNVFGNLATAAISNAYYPAENRNGVGLTLGNSAIGIAEGAIGNILQEFLIKRLTPKVPDYGAVNKP
jgi:hypothetical protein